MGHVLSHACADASITPALLFALSDVASVSLRNDTFTILNSIHELHQPVLFLRTSPAPQIKRLQGQVAVADAQIANYQQQTGEVSQKGLHRPRHDV